MRLGWRQWISVLAMYVIALNTILVAALAPVPAVGSFDPLSAICHSIAQTADQTAAQVQDGQPAKPSKACDHCSLCSATTASSHDVDSVLAGILAPGRLLRVLHPSDAAHTTSVDSSPSLARGPPSRNV
ncbi:DUF2946 family protein [Pseudolabrys sp. FHR47]|uniref:DUF2946 family protein n=1 Tax=Pseudolabrys sp. FHR47 TaxID=2562284 RepID=UPI00143CC714|nr:DUF2946 family protein [Pseudolabrys sp. FHR47]